MPTAAYWLGYRDAKANKPINTSQVWPHQADDYLSGYSVGRRDHARPLETAQQAQGA